MKRWLIFLVFSLFATSIFATAGKVLAVKGKVELQKNGQWRPAQNGDDLDSGTLISTGFKAELTIKVDGSTIVVQALTRLRLDEIVKKGDVVSSKVYLDLGSIKANVKPAETKKVAFTVRTPVATASVRGTSGEISYNGVLNGQTGVWDYENANGDKVLVYAGDTVSIDNFGNITPAQITFQQDVKPQAPTTPAEQDMDYKGVDDGRYDNDINFSPAPTTTPPSQPHREPEEKEADVIVDIDWAD